MLVFLYVLRLNNVLFCWCQAGRFRRRQWAWMRQEARPAACRERNPRGSNWTSRPFSWRRTTRRLSARWSATLKPEWWSCVHMMRDLWQLWLTVSLCLYAVASEACAQCQHARGKSTDTHCCLGNIQELPQTSTRKTLHAVCQEVRNTSTLFLHFSILFSPGYNFSSILLVY